jgi:hypothetical protein
MQSRIKPKIRHPGKPPSATIIDPRANGRAKTVCENRMKVRKREMKLKVFNMELRNSGKEM